MKKTNKLFVLALSAVMAVSALALSACGGEAGKTDEPTTAPQTTEAPKIDFSAYTKDQFLKEDFSKKKISYQFTGSWSLAEYGMYFEFAYNVYEDGSVKVDQRLTGSSSSYLYYGFWEDASDEDGKAITIDTMFMTDLEGGLIDHATDYTIYQESDGNFSFGFDFCMAPGQYKRVADLAGGSSVKYQSDDAFHTAVDKPADAQ